MATIPPPISPREEESSKTVLARNAWIGIASSIALGAIALASLPLLTAFPRIRNFDLIMGIQLCVIPIIIYWVFGKHWGLREYIKGDGELARIEESNIEVRNETETDQDVRRTTISIIVFGGVGLLSICLLAVSTGAPFSWKHFSKVIGLGFLYAGAFFGIGALIGFLFGIPRSLQGRHKLGPNGVDSVSQSSNPAFATNTNLEEISDWLTKIIVGLGLINLKAVPGLLKTAAWYFGNFCGADFCEAASLGLILYFATCGFFLGYLITRLFLTGAFTRAEASGTVGGPTVRDNEEIKETPVSVEVVSKPTDLQN